jgi:transcriptional regulator with XRE-family HTH domain
VARAFGELFKSLRVQSGQTLRRFCQSHGFDPGNVSKLERGLLPPPQSPDKLGEYALALGLSAESRELAEFVDLGLACSGQIPADVMRDEELVARLPALLRTVSGKKLSSKQLDEFIETIRRA